jgi:PHS family inorganic phosphate transporter-like MFS transporter
VAGVGFFIEGYDIFAVGLLTTMLGIVYWPTEGSMPMGLDTTIKVAVSGGSVVGQLGFGALADLIGRKRMYGLELIIIIFATLAQSLTSASPSIDIVGVITFCRVIVGIGDRPTSLITSKVEMHRETNHNAGIGSDYSLSPIIVSE